MKKRVVLISLGILIILCLNFPNIFNRVRYEYEKNYTDPMSTFYDIEFGVITESSMPNFEEQYETNEDNQIVVDKKYISKLNILCIKGEILNSFDPVIVMLNGKVISNKRSYNKKSVAFWHPYYSNKYFNVEFKDTDLKDINEFTFISGRASGKVNVIID